MFTTDPHINHNILRCDLCGAINRSASSMTITQFADAAEAGWQTIPLDTPDGFDLGMYCATCAQTLKD